MIAFSFVFDLVGNIKGLHNRSRFVGREHHSNDVAAAMWSSIASHGLMSGGFRVCSSDGGPPLFSKSNPIMSWMQNPKKKQSGCCLWKAQRFMCSSDVVSLAAVIKTSFCSITAVQTCSRLHHTGRLFWNVSWNESDTYSFWHENKVYYGYYLQK